jgi:hypothetical protein
LPEHIDPDFLEQGKRAIWGATANNRWKNDWLWNFRFRFSSI